MNLSDIPVFGQLFNKKVNNPASQQHSYQSPVYDAAAMLKEAAQIHNIHLSLLVAETAIWASPEVHKKLMEENGYGDWFPNTRRYRPGQGEKRGQIIDGVKLDDNSYANQAIKKAVGISRERLIGFEACHIWPDTCYDPRYHTTIANLVLLPRAIAGLSDHDAEVQAALQYRSFELYGWYPVDSPNPSKPDFYPQTWREAEPFTQDVSNALRWRKNSSQPGSSHEGPAPAGPGPNSKTPSDIPTDVPRSSNTSPVGFRIPSAEKLILLERIGRWAQNPRLNVYKIIALVVKAKTGIPREILVQEANRVSVSKNAYGAVGSLLTTKANAYGRVFTDIDGIITIHPDLAEEVARILGMYSLKLAGLLQANSPITYQTDAAALLMALQEDAV